MSSGSWKETEAKFIVNTSKDFVFVFGSNLAGRHGKGAALFALKNYGAMYGIPFGRQGRSYAIPTKDATLRPLTLNKIEGYVKDFIEYTKLYPHFTFGVTRVGCGLAGYKDHQIAPFFKDSPSNVVLPREWQDVIAEIKSKENSTKNSVDL